MTRTVPETSVAILLLVHTVATRGGEGQVAGVKIERLDQDGTTPTLRHLARARTELAAQGRIAEELRAELGAKIKLTQKQARAIERVRALADEWDRDGEAIGWGESLRDALDGGTEV